MRLPFGLDGPAPVWPRPMDAALDAWAALPGRARVVLRAAATMVVALAATGGLLRGPYGPPVEVVVAARMLPAGAAIDATDVGVDVWPRDLVPEGALRAPTDLPGATVTTGALPQGTVVTWQHVAADGAATFADATTAVLPVSADAIPALPVGARLDLAATSPDGGAVVVARDATLVADDGVWRWIRVPRSSVPAVAGAISRGSLVIAVLPPAPRAGAP